jgi:hypothetical protein
VAEFLLGNLPITALGSLILLIPMYGGGSLLIREGVRRSGRGWPSILVLALAYGVIEEGIATMSLFNPNYAGQRLLDYGYIPDLGIGGPWTVLVLTLHVVWSISVPIALVEVLASSRRTTPWLGRAGLIVTALLFLAGVGAMTAFSVATSGFVAAPSQLVASGVIAAGLVAVGLGVLRPPTSAPDSSAGHAPPAWLVGVMAFVVSSAFKLLPIGWSPWLYVGVTLGLALLAILAVGFWSRQQDWGDAHRLAVATGPLLTYAWTAFPQHPVLPVNPTVDLFGNIVFAVAAIILVAVAAMRVRRRSSATLAVIHNGEAPSSARSSSHRRPAETAHGRHAV